LQARSKFRWKWKKNLGKDYKILYIKDYKKNKLVEGLVKQSRGVSCAISLSYLGRFKTLISHSEEAHSTPAKEETQDEATIKVREEGRAETRSLDGEAKSSCESCDL
jgi:hypothetical protein